MSSPAQLSANCQNAKFSTGPSTPQGKVQSSRNAVTHGLSSSTFALLAHEDASEFHQQIESYRRKFAPRDDHESFLVDRMVESRWKLARIQRLEVAVLDQMTAQAPAGVNPETIIAAALLKGNAKAYLTLQRYAAAAERSYYKAKSELDKGRTPVRRTASEIMLNAMNSAQSSARQNEANPQPPLPSRPPLPGPHCRLIPNPRPKNLAARL